MYSIIDASVRSKIVVTPRQVTDFYQRYPELFIASEVRKLEVTTTQDPDQARKIYNELKSAKPPEGIGENGKTVTLNEMIVSKGQLRKDIEAVVFKLKPGEVCEPVVIQNTYYVFRLKEVIASRQESLAESRQKAYAFLFNKRMQEDLTKWLETLKKRSYIALSTK